MNPTLPPLDDDSIEAAERRLRERMCGAIADWIVGTRIMPTPPSPLLVEMANRFLQHIRDWSRR